jgi:hypothetical protein
MPIVYPAVARDEERIRFTVHAGNTEEEMQLFVRAVLDILSEGNCDESIPPGTVFDDGMRITAKL